MSEKWIPNPAYDKADGEVVIYGQGIPVGRCSSCWMPTNGLCGSEFICSFCKEEVIVQQ